jgi:hypothetical protein
MLALTTNIILLVQIGFAENFIRPFKNALLVD